MMNSDVSKKALDRGVVSDREVWAAIRYLDPQSERNRSDFVIIVVLFAAVSLLTVVLVLMRVRGL
jgi:hypothetical protein